jgi:putative transferase (TIGR04331 family)
VTSVSAHLIPVFLATTALEEFWDTDQPIVFLGDWCTLYARREIWEKLDYQILKSPYDSDNVGEDIYSAVSEIYEKILPILGVKLNEIHGVNYGERYWRITIGPWFQWYLPTLYDHFLHIKIALKQYPEFTTFGLTSASFVTPLDTMDFVELRKSDIYNLQLYTRILKFFGRNFPCKAAEFSRPNNLQSKTSFLISCKFDKSFMFLPKIGNFG